MLWRPEKEIIHKTNVRIVAALQCSHPSVQRTLNLAAMKSRQDAYKTGLSYTPRDTVVTVEGGTLLALDTVWCISGHPGQAFGDREDH